MGSSESAPIIVNRERGEHDTECRRAIRGCRDNSASDYSSTGQDKQDRREGVPGRTVNAAL
jgi:hypothetical protein